VGLRPLFHIISRLAKTEGNPLKKQPVSVRVEEIITPFISQEELELVDIEYKKEGGELVSAHFHR
jgi:hypothetical protein